MTQPAFLLTGTRARVRAPLGPMPSHTPQTAAPEPSRWTISVVVNNYNYGHFLDSCLASVAVQSRPPDQIVVVDDGSTDGSLARLEGRDDLTVIAQKNGGQAAAFNAGFAAATGEVILFLDADDLLRPDALEVVERLWTEETTWLSYRMDKVDADGRLVGHYEMAMPRHDLLPQMMKDLTFPFMPTSGNVFGRAALAWAFPLPAERWRISADALLVRAALLTGPCVHINQVLADYRVHGANNYHREDVSRDAQNRRNVLHIAEAGIDLVRIADRAGGRLSRGQRAKLLMAALRNRVRAELQEPDPQGLRAFLAQLRDVCPASLDARLATYLALLTPILPRSETLRRWIAEPRERPERLQRFLNLLMGRGLTQTRTELVAPRAPLDSLPEVQTFKERPPGFDSLMTAHEWHWDEEKGGCDLCGTCGRLTFYLPPEEQCILWLTALPLGQGSRRIVVFANGELVLSHWIHGKETFRVPLPVQPPGENTPVDLEIHVPDFHTQRQWFRWRGPRLPRLKVLAVDLKVEPKSVPDLVLPVQADRRFEDLAAGLRMPDGTPAEDAEAIGSGEWFRLAPPALSSPFCLSLRFSARQAVGDLLVMVNGKPAFSGIIGPRAQIIVDMPPGSGAPTGALDVSFTFRPEVFLEGTDIWLAAMGWQTFEDREDSPNLRPGERAVSGLGRGLKPFLGAGWQDVPDDGAMMTGPSADLSFAPEVAAAERSLRLDLEPLDPFAAETPPIMLVTVAGEEAARVALAGRAEIDVPLPGKGLADLDVALHAASPDDDGTPSADHGGVLLRGVALVAGPADLPIAGPTIPANPPHLSPLKTLLQSPSTEISDDLRDAVAAEIEQTSPAALWYLLSADDLRAMGEIGARATPGKSPVDWDGTTAGWLHAAILELLHREVGPALERPLEAFPALGADRRPAVAECLAGGDAVRTTKLLDDARQTLARVSLGSTLWAFASDVVDACGERTLDDDAVSALAAAREVRDLRDGHRLAPETTPNRPPRYLFHHIAKTGGTSLKRVLSEWFEIVEDYHDPWDGRAIQSPIDSAILKPNQMIFGHYRTSGIALGERYPGVLNSGEWKVIAFVREPLDWVLSDYHYAKKNRPVFDASHVPHALGEHLRGRHSSFLDWLDCDADNWRDRLDQYWFIGTLERMDECIEWLAGELGKPVPTGIPVENATPRTEEPTQEDVHTFRENNALEYEIYGEINARLDRLLGPRKG